MKKGQFRPRGSSCSSTKPWKCFSWRMPQLSSAAAACASARPGLCRQIGRYNEPAPLRPIAPGHLVTAPHIRLGIRRQGRHPLGEGLSAVLQHPSATAGLISKDRWQSNAAEFKTIPFGPRWCAVEANQLALRGKNQCPSDGLSNRRGKQPPTARCGLRQPRSEGC